MTTPPLPDETVLHRHGMWLCDEELRDESVADAERFIEDVGFVNTLTDFAPLVRTPHLPRRHISQA